MSAKIRVLQGPDQGREFQLGLEAVRIGTTATAGICLTDPGLQGELVVELRDGVYHVTNRMMYSIYLDKKSLPSGQRTVWFDDAVLQPTAETQLTLQRDFSRSLPSGERSRNKEVVLKKKTWEISNTTILAVAGVILAILILASAPPPATNTVRRLSESRLRTESVEFLMQLDSLRGLNHFPLMKHQLDLVRRTLAEARVAEARSDREVALKHYLQINGLIHRLHQELPRARKAPENPLAEETANSIQESLDRISTIVNQRLIDLGTR